MENYTQDVLNEIWEKAETAEGYDSKKYRKDMAGAFIQKDKYGTKDTNGWEVDLIFPQTLGGNTIPANMRALQWENKKSKGDNFPVFSTIVTSDGNHNIKHEQEWEFTRAFIKLLKEIYPDNKYLRKKNK